MDNPTEYKAKIEPAADAVASAEPQATERRNFLKLMDFSLPMEAWHSTRNVMSGILVASLIVNIVSLAFPLTLLQIYDRIIPNVAYSTLILLVVGVAIALILETILRVVRSYVGAWADSKFEHAMGCEAFKHLIESPLEEYIHAGAGSHIKRINSINQMRDFYAGQALVSVADFPFIIILFGLIILIAGKLALVPAVLLIIFLIITLVHAKNLQKVLEGRQAHDERRSNFIIEALSNIHTIKSVTMESQMMRRYERLQRTSAVSDYDMSLLGSESVINTQMLSQLTIVIMVTLGSVMVINGSLTIGGLAACTLLGGRVLQPIGNLIGVWTRLQSIRIARDELQKILDLPLESVSTAPPLIATAGEVEFKDVMFRYSPDEPYVLKSFNLKVPGKEAISISGSGLSGKSTICWLLLAMMHPQAGRVLIDGQDIFECQVKSVREKIGYLPQQGVLFNGTIIDNLTMYSKDKAMHAKGLAAAKLVGLSEIIEHLPQGYETMVADQSIDSLPRGLRQRIAIARAFVHEPPIIVFDEANTAIDMQGDAAIKELLQKLVGRVTLIIISHRPSVVSIASKHYVLEGGHLRLKA